MKYWIIQTPAGDRHITKADIEPIPNSIAGPYSSERRARAAMSSPESVSIGVTTFLALYLLVIGLAAYAFV